MGWRWVLLLHAITAGTGFAQPWEIGAAAGFGAYRNGSIYAPAGVAAAGVRNRYAVSIWLGEDLYPRLAGEIRYTYQDGDPFLSAGTLKTNVQGQSHTLHYGLVAPLRDPGGRWRPYFTAGVGAKLYRVTGPETLNPPLTEIARLRTTSQWTPLAVVGAGIQLRAGRCLFLRLDWLDYITPFPKRVIEPARYATPRGLLHQFTPSIGLSVKFRTLRP